MCNLFRCYFSSFATTDSIQAGCSSTFGCLCGSSHCSCNISVGNPFGFRNCIRSGGSYFNILFHRTDGKGVVSVVAGDTSLIRNTVIGGISGEEATGNKVLHILAINSGDGAVEVAASDGKLDLADTSRIVGLGIAFVHSVFTRNGATRNGNIDRQLGGMLGNSNANAVGGGAVVICLALKRTLTSNGAVGHSQITSANFGAGSTSDGTIIKCSCSVTSLINTMTIYIDCCTINS